MHSIFFLPWPPRPPSFLTLWPVSKFFVQKLWGLFCNLVAPLLVFEWGKRRSTPNRKYSILLLMGIFDDDFGTFLDDFWMNLFGLFWMLWMIQYANKSDFWLKIIKTSIMGKVWCIYIRFLLMLTPKMPHGYWTKFGNSGHSA